MRGTAGASEPKDQQLATKGYCRHLIGQPGPSAVLAGPYLERPMSLQVELCETDLHKLSTVIKEDGNDGAHQGTLTKEEAFDLLDFTTELLERVFTQPKKLELAEKRREQRRAPAREK